MTLITGGCLCKQVRYEFSAEPIAMRLCWCRDCQYFASGNATVNVVFRSEALKSQGDLRDYQSVADSGSRMHRRFCPNCGTHVFSASEARPHLVIVRNGTLDDTELLKPSPPSGLSRRRNGPGSTSRCPGTPVSRRPWPDARRKSCAR